MKSLNKIALSLVTVASVVAAGATVHAQQAQMGSGMGGGMGSGMMGNMGPGMHAGMGNGMLGHGMMNGQMMTTPHKH